MTDIKCKICKKPTTEPYIGTECYDCWEKDIDEKKVKELRERLSQYLDFDRFKLKENLSLGQLKEVRKIIKDNYVEGSDIGGKASKEGGRELIKAFWKTGEKIGWQPSKCLKEINSEIEKLEPKPVMKKYIQHCPECGEEFFCELDETLTSKKEEADDILNEQVNKHVKSFHKPQKKERKIPDSPLPSKNNGRDKANNTNDPNDTYQHEDSKSNKSDENKNTFVILVVTSIILLLVGGIVAYLLWKKKQNS